MSRNYGKDRSVYGYDFKVNHHKRGRHHKFKEPKGYWYYCGVSEFKEEFSRSFKAHTKRAMQLERYDLMPIMSKSCKGNFWW